MIAAVIYLVGGALAGSRAELGVSSAMIGFGVGAPHFAWSAALAAAYRSPGRPVLGVDVEGGGFFPDHDTTFVALFNASALVAETTERNATGVIYDRAAPRLLEALFGE